MYFITTDCIRFEKYQYPSLQGKVGPQSSSASLAFKSWWKPAFTFNISGACSWLIVTWPIKKFLFIVTIRFNTFYLIIHLGTYLVAIFLMNPLCISWWGCATMVCAQHGGLGDAQMVQCILFEAYTNVWRVFRPIIAMELFHVYIVCAISMQYSGCKC